MLNKTPLANVASNHLTLIHEGPSHHHPDIAESSVVILVRNTKVIYVVFMVFEIFRPYVQILGQYTKITYYLLVLAFFGINMREACRIQILVIVYFYHVA